jgi:hypothetical protein
MDYNECKGIGITIKVPIEAPDDFFGIKIDLLEYDGDSLDPFDDDDQIGYFEKIWSYEDFGNKDSYYDKDIAVFEDDGHYTLSYSISLEKVPLNDFPLPSQDDLCFDEVFNKEFEIFYQGVKAKIEFNVVYKAERTLVYLGGSFTDASGKKFPVVGELWGRFIDFRIEKEFTKYKTSQRFQGIVMRDKNVISGVTWIDDAPHGFYMKPAAP